MHPHEIWESRSKADITSLQLGLLVSKICLKHLEQFLFSALNGLIQMAVGSRLRQSKLGHSAGLAFL